MSNRQNVEERFCTGESETGKPRFNFPQKMHTRQQVPTTPVVNLPMMRFVHCTCIFYTEQKHKEVDAIITYACFGINWVESSPAGAFLRRVFYE